jgi:hypothetical protein
MFRGFFSAAKFEFFNPCTGGVVQWHIVFTAGAEDRGFESRHGVRYFRA